MADKIYLAGRAVSFSSGRFGHLYFIRWDDEALTGFTTEGQGVGNLGARVNLDALVAENNPATFKRELFHTLNTLDITNLLGGSVDAAWTRINGLATQIGNANYNYDAVDGYQNSNEPIANSNAVAVVLHPQCSWDWMRGTVDRRG